MAERLQVSATRMQLMQLRKRLSTAVHGHSLLKDKLEGLMAEFLKLIQIYKTARRTLDAEYPEVVKLFLLAGLAASREAVRSAIMQSRGEMTLSETTRNVLSVIVPHFEAEVRPGAAYSLLDTPLEFDEASAGLAEYFPRILELAETEHAVWLLMEEIERTRRRVNALEYILIPQLRETVKYVQGKLDENERGNITRLMKIKEMRLAQERAAALERREAR